MTWPGPDPKAICREALHRAAGPERSAYLDRACRGDVTLRLQVESLLRTHDEAAGSVGPSAPGALHDGAIDHTPEPEIGTTISVAGRLGEKPGATIGPYKLLQKIGEGGMGTVFMAEQTQPVRRTVALKVIRPGMDTAQVIARFEAERQALAIMDHASIARVLDVGATDTGRPFFVMELVKGVPITEYSDRNHLTPRERLALFIPVCQAIQHAHQKGIIHRDIKPSNVLVTLHDGKPVPKVIDFGVAKAIDHRLTERTIFTEFGAVIGTLEYMSPEQAEMGALDIDTRSDIYSLGVLLYELLAGSTPLERVKLCKAAHSEVLRRIREEEPPKPSTRLSESKDALPSISAQRKMEPARLTKLVRGELDWIVMKSLEKDRTRRYETANGFAKDIQRYLDGDAVEACPPSATYNLRKFARKHSAALATAGAFAFLLVAATAVSAVLAVRADRERARAVNAEKSAKDQRGRAHEREQMAIDAVKRYGDVVRDTPELKNNPALSGLRATLLKEPKSFFTQLRDQLSSDGETTPRSLARLAAASFDLGILTNEIGDKEAALRTYQESLAIRDRIARENPTVTQFQRDLAVSHNYIGLQQHETGRLAEALSSYEQTRAILERLARDNPSAPQLPSDLATCHLNIGNLRHETGRPAEAIESYERARAIRERLARDYPAVTELQSELARIHYNIGILQRETGRLPEAVASHRQARTIREKLARENPADLRYQLDLAQSLNDTGAMQVETGQPAKAIVSYEQAREILVRLARENQSVIQVQIDLARCSINLGNLEHQTGRPAKALASHERARAILERLTRVNPSVTAIQRDLAASHNSIGNLQHETGRSADAVASFEQARVICQRLARENPAVTQFQSNLSAICNNIGRLEQAAGRLAEALAAFDQARAIDDRLAREHPESPDFASSLGGTLNNLAIVDLLERQFDAGRAKLAQATEWQRKALAANPNNPTYRQFLANHLTNLARAAELTGRAREAELARRELAELADRDPAKAAVDARLAAILKGHAPNDDTERLVLATRAYEKALHASSARLFAEALASTSKLADDRQAQHRYNAACAAALAASGRGKDDPPPDDAAKARLRRQALEWLQAEFAAWAKVVDAGPDEMKAKITPTLQHWKADADLAGIRDTKELARLPEDERVALRQLWKEVDRLLTNETSNK